MPNKQRHRRRVFTDQERHRIIGELTGSTLKELCKRHGISKRTLNRWLIKFVGSNRTKRTGRLSDLINDLERENKQLRNKVAELWVDYNNLRSALVKPGREC